MKTILIGVVALLIAMPALPQTDLTWTLDTSTLTYHMSHPVHKVDGVSHVAQGKGTCHAGMCDFLVTAPVKSFDSGNTSRDQHMLQVTRGAEFPVVSVRLRIPQAALDGATLDCDLEVQFAGNTAHYEHVAFQQAKDGAIRHITGTVPATLTDFKIPPPSFLTVPIKNAIPVKVDLVWKPA
jgi:hypothetical protein